MTIRTIMHLDEIITIIIKVERSEKNIQKRRFEGAESSSQGSFINNVEDSPGRWSLGVKATRDNTTRQTKR